MAVPALTAAAAVDPLHAVVGAFHHAYATFADQPAALIAGLHGHLRKPTAT